MTRLMPVGKGSPGKSLLEIPDHNTPDILVWLPLQRPAMNKTSFFVQILGGETV